MRLQKLLAQLRVSTLLPPRLQFSASQLRKSAGSYSQHARDCKNCSLSCASAPSCLRGCNFRRLSSANELASPASSCRIKQKNLRINPSSGSFVQPPQQRVIFEYPH
ncbi:hypothetical protein J2736_005585 [Paenibacillus qinlingensis]|uniref:Uncharacterized protein n=1 Tax=Paenibacillus qinlingensis TaxID=1837343 RepID=A0ABU1P3N3_9BACL|nr:hypothetical protein [Paenibacillus qinlingensis]